MPVARRAAQGAGMRRIGAFLGVALALGGAAEAAESIAGRAFDCVIEPEQVVRVINNYLGTMADVILAWDGTIDEFIGDSVLGFFGAPVARPDDAPGLGGCPEMVQVAVVHGVRSMVRASRAWLQGR